MKKLMTLTAMTIALSSTAFAADATFKGTASAQNTIGLSNIASALDLSRDLDKTTIFSYSIRNNDPDGFKLSFTSKNSSQMRRTSGYDKNSIGTYLSYNVSIVRGKKGTLGASEVTLPKNRKLSSQTPLELDYNQQVNQGTKDADYSLEIQTTDIAKKSLISGQYSDTITVTIANL
jgi:hypothetical protein